MSHVSSVMLLFQGRILAESRKPATDPQPIILTDELVRLVGKHRHVYYRDERSPKTEFSVSHHNFVEWDVETDEAPYLTTLYMVKISPAG